MKILMILMFMAILFAAGCTNKSSTTNKTEEAQTCGGIAGIKCPDGYICDYGNQTDIADAAGYCIQQK